MILIDAYIRRLNIKIAEVYNKLAQSLIYGEIPAAEYDKQVAYLRALRDVQDLIKEAKKEYEDRS